MDGWWTEIEAEIRAVVRLHPTMTLDESSAGQVQSEAASVLCDPPGERLRVARPFTHRGAAREMH